MSLGFDGFIDYLRGPGAEGAVLSVQRFCDVLGIDMQTLAVLAQVHGNTNILAAAPEQVQKFLCETLRVMRAFYGVSGDVSRSIRWYRDELLPPFGHKTAEQLVSEGRTEDVFRYAASLEAGAVG